jgi:hypothetical protein
MSAAKYTISMQVHFSYLALVHVRDVDSEERVRNIRMSEDGWVRKAEVDNEHGSEGKEMIKA